MLFLAHNLHDTYGMNNYNRVSKYGLSTWTTLFCTILTPMPTSIPAGGLQGHMLRSRLINTCLFGSILYVVCIMHKV